ncbi:MAG: hypothetical protein JXR84_16145 [Anaerolineae bacterium]|nr:hypothetical protein [Anaerolineae bacterium]
MVPVNFNPSYKDAIRGEWLKAPRDFTNGNLRSVRVDALPDMSARAQGIRVTFTDGKEHIFPLEVTTGRQPEWPTADMEPAVPLSTIKSIDLLLSKDSNDTPDDRAVCECPLEYEVRIPGGTFYLYQPVTWKCADYTGISSSANEISVPVLRMKMRLPDYSVITHLNDNALYYSQAVWASGDSLLLNRVLARYNVNDPYPDPKRNLGDAPNLRPLASCVDPAPVAMTGNYLGFIWHFENEDARQVWLEHNGFKEGAEKTETLVSLPSGGVFAEAVLGRFNAAEKLDLSRFWNWQDSPIPILPPDIAPVQSGSRARDMALDAGQLGTPAVQLPVLQQLPDPTGAGSVLNALTTSNMFRDMSGQAEVAAALQKSVELSASGSEHASEQAGKAMQALMQHQQALASIAAGVAKTGITAGVEKAKLANANVSKIGAVINSAEKADAAFAKQSAAPTPPQAPAKTSKAPTPPPLPPKPKAAPSPSKTMPFKTAAYTSVIGELEGVLKARGKWQQNGDDDTDTSSS